MFQELKVSTTTIVGTCDCSFDIDVIFNKIKIEGNIIKLKCNNKEKTKDKETVCKTFYNQITIHFDDNVNIKLFNNGKFQISGVKNKDIAIQKLKAVLIYISDIKGEMEITPDIYKGVYIYKNKIIKPYNDGYICENLIKNGKVLIENNECEEFPLMKNILVQKNHKDKQKKLYDHFGRNVGKIVYHMIRKNKNLCIKNATYTKINDLEYDIWKSDKYQLQLGKLEIILDVEPEPREKLEKLKLYFSCCSSSPIIKEIKEANTNFNIKLKLLKDQFVDRQKFCSLLELKSISYLYDPSKYPGVKLTLLDTKITVFRTGSILFSKKSEDISIEDVLQELKTLFEEGDVIRKKEKIENVQTDISIWDLL